MNHTACAMECYIVPFEIVKNLLMYITQIIKDKGQREKNFHKIGFTTSFLPRHICP